MKHAKTFNLISYWYWLVSSGIAKVGHMPHQLDTVPRQKCFLVKFKIAIITFFNYSIFVFLTYQSHP